MKYPVLMKKSDDRREMIWENLRSIKINRGQLDPNGLCNAGCWYCPVKYEGNPEEFITQLSLEHIDLILKKIKRSSVADPLFKFIYTAHYNEVLLYRDFSGMIDVFRQNGFTTMVLSNGTPLHPAKIDLIIKSEDVIRDVVLNVPSLFREDWEAKAGFGSNTKLFDLLLRNLDYLHAHVINQRVIILVNTLTERFKSEALSGAILTSAEQLANILSEFKNRYPKFQVDLVEHLVDRAGHLSNVRVLKNQHAVMFPGQKVFGCKHDLINGSRLYGWLHVNSKGELFLCCDDYQMKYRFGSLIEKELDELWLSEDHVDQIEQSFNELCKNCTHHYVA